MEPTQHPSDAYTVLCGADPFCVVLDDTPDPWRHEDDQVYRVELHPAIRIGYSEDEPAA